MSDEDSGSEDSICIKSIKPTLECIYHIDGYDIMHKQHNYAPYPDIYQYKPDIKFSLQYTNELGRTSFMIAAESGNLALTKLFFNVGSNPNWLDYDENSSLILASINGHIDVVQYLIDIKARLNIVAYHNYSALISAIKHGQTEIAKLLIHSKAHLEYYDEDGNTAIMLATKYGFIDVLTLLIEKGANIFYKNHRGQYAITIAKNREIRKIINGYIDKNIYGK